MLFPTPVRPLGRSVVLFAACCLPQPFASSNRQRARCRPASHSRRPPASRQFERPVACGNRAAPTTNTHTGARGGHTGRGGMNGSPRRRSHRQPQSPKAEVLSVIIGFSQVGMERWSERVLPAFGSFWGLQFGRSDTAKRTVWGRKAHPFDRSDLSCLFSDGVGGGRWAPPKRDEGGVREEARRVGEVSKPAAIDLEIEPSLFVRVKGCFVGRTIDYGRWVDRYT